jgi:hypothetical protein
MEKSLEGSLMRTDSYQDIESLFAASLSIGFIVTALIFAVLVYCVGAFFMMRLFKKANVEAWKAWVPIVNGWTFLELGGFPGWIALLAILAVVPIISLFVGILLVVFQALAAYQIGLKLRKDAIFVVVYIIFAIVWFGICGLDRSVWDDSLGKPSRIPGTPTSGGYAPVPSTQPPAGGAPRS